MVNEKLKIFSDYGQGGRYLVLAGNGRIEDLTEWRLKQIRLQLDHSEREKLDRYSGN